MFSLRHATMEIGHDSGALRALPVFKVHTLDRTFQICAENAPALQLWYAWRGAQQDHAMRDADLAAPPMLLCHRINNVDATIRAARAENDARLGDKNLKTMYSGYLVKADPRGKHWKKRCGAVLALSVQTRSPPPHHNPLLCFRFCVLDPARSSLTYYTNDSKKVEKGNLSLEGAT